MKHAPIALVLLGACYGGNQYDWEARAIVGAKPQRVPIAQLGAIGPTATHLSIRTVDVDLTYPLHIDGTDLVLDSLFDDTGYTVAYDPYSEDVATRPRPGSLAVEMWPARYTEDEPGLQQFGGRLEVSVLDATNAARVKIELRPQFDPCAVGEYYGDPRPDVTPLPPFATMSSRTCLDGTECVPPGATLSPTPTKLVVFPFVLTIRVQAACSVSTG